MTEADDALHAERAVLGALIAMPEHVREVPRLKPRHFTDPRHQKIMQAVLDADASDAAVPDELVVFHKLQVAGHIKAGDLDGAFLMALRESVPTVLNAAYYGQIVLDAARRRALLHFAHEARTAAERAVDDDQLTARIAELLTTAEGLAHPQSVVAGGRPAGYYQLAEFVDAQSEADAPWIIPGLLRAMERVVIVADEGAGKTTIARAVATATAAGRHFLVPEARFPSKRTLMVDLENPPSLIRSKMRPMVSALRTMGGWDDDRCWLYSRPGGVNLRSADDAAMLERIIEQANPHLVCFGPVYKAYIEGATDRAAQAAREVVAVLDRLREKYGFALWIEAHAPLEQNGGRQLRPFGSQLWLAWPEFGIGLRRETNERTTPLLVQPFRGHRDEREWPSKILRGDPDYWPLTAEWENGMPTWLRLDQPYSETAS